MLLREKDKQTLIKIFADTKLQVEVWAYGSRINGTAHAGSDLDLVIRSQSLTPIPPTVYSELIEKIRDSNIPILVELRDWAKLPESFHKTISQSFEILYSPNQNDVNEPQAEYKTKTDKQDQSQ
jgi:predicted nucleotidyltransferase